MVEAEYGDYRHALLHDEKRNAMYVRTAHSARRGRGVVVMLAAGAIALAPAFGTGVASARPTDSPLPPVTTATPAPQTPVQQAPQVVPQPAPVQQAPIKQAPPVQQAPAPEPQVQAPVNVPAPKVEAPAPRQTSDPVPPVQEPAVPAPAPVKEAPAPVSSPAPEPPVTHTEVTPSVTRAPTVPSVDISKPPVTSTSTVTPTSTVSVPAVTTERVEPSRDVPSPITTTAVAPTDHPSSHGPDKVPSSVEQSATNPVQSGDQSSPRESESGSKQTPAPKEAPTATSPVVLPAPKEAQLTGPVAPREKLREETPAVLSDDPASDADIQTVANAVKAAHSGHDNDHGNRPDHPSSSSQNPGHPGGGNQGGMQCDNQRRPGQCDWNNNWWHDDRGRPVISNPFLSIDILVQVCDPATGQLYTVRVAAGSQRAIDVPRAGNYTFVVVQVDTPNASVNVGVGMFNSAGPCNQYCSVPNRPSLNVSVRVNVWTNNVWQPVDVPAYGCNTGCQPLYVQDNRSYYQYYFDGNNPVVGYWDGGQPFQEGASFVPTEWRPPAATAPVPVTVDNIREVTGFEEPGSSTNPGVMIDHRLQYALSAAAVLVILGLGVGGAVWYRRRTV